MAKINEVLVKVLGLASDPASLNYYNLLGLPPFTADEEQISGGIQKAVARLQAAAQSESPATIDAVKKVLQQGSAILTNPQKKKAYDKQLRALLEKTSAEATGAAATASAKAPSSPAPAAANVKAPQAAPSRTAAAPTPAKAAQSVPSPVAVAPAPFVPQAVDPLAGYLPAGDPLAEFSMKDYLSEVAASPPIESVEARMAELEKLRSGIAVMASPVAQYSSAHYSSPLEVDEYRSEPQGNEETSFGTIQQRIRRKRAVKNAMAIGGLCLVSVLLLAVAMWKYLDRPVKTAQVPENTNKAASNLPNPAARASKQGENANKAVTPQPSLPSVKANSGEGQSHFSEMPSESTQPATQEEMPMEAPATSAMTPEPATPQPMEKGPGTWDETLKKTRESIAKKDFEKFNTSINELMAIPVSDRKLDDIRNVVDRTGQLYKLGTESFENSIKKLQSGATINTGDDTISCVEAKETELIFRIKGKNTTFKRNELPSDIVVALLNLDLDAKNPTDVATRGVFFKLYNTAKDYQEIGDKYLEQAAEADPKFSKIDDLADAAYHSS